MSDLTEFLLARIAEDEQDYVTRFREGRWPTPRELGEANRWEAECKAKRRIVERHSQTVECGNVGCQRRGLSGLHCLVCDDEWPCPDLRTLAAVYADHPSYREEWKP